MLNCRCRGGAVLAIVALRPHDVTVDVSVVDVHVGVVDVHVGVVDVQVARRRTEVSQEVPIYGDFKELAYYYATVYVGTPPVPFTVIADTGSTLLAFSCRGCSSCAEHPTSYDFGASSTSSSVSADACRGVSAARYSSQCTFAVDYAEGSHISGPVYADLVYLGADNETADSTAALSTAVGVVFPFGCIDVETNLFKSQFADGIMGLSQGPCDHRVVAVLVSYWCVSCGCHGVDVCVMVPCVCWCRVCGC